MTKDYNDMERKDDLDLISLVERIFSFLRSYGRLIALSTITGMLVGLCLFFISPKKYASTLLLHSFTLTNTEYINIIDNWDELLKRGEYEALSADLDCDPRMLEKVSSISASEIQKLYLQNNPNGFMVEVVVSDTAVLDPLERGIIHGFENGGYLKEKLASKKSNLNQLIERANIEIMKLDSIKHSIERSINNNTSGSSSFIIDISNITGQRINLNEKLLGYSEELKFANAVQVLHDFAKFKKPTSPKLIKLLALGFLAGFCIGYVIAVYRHVRKKITYRSHAQNI